MKRAKKPAASLILESGYIVVYHILNEGIYPLRKIRRGFLFIKRANRLLTSRKNRQKETVRSVKKRSVNSRKYSLLFATFVALFSICTAGVSTFAWFALTYANKMAYGSATIQTTDSNLQVAIQSYAGATIDGSAHQAEGINYWNVPFSGHLDDLSYNGNGNEPFYKMTWADDAVGVTATAKTGCGIATGATNGFYLFRLRFTNSSATNTIYVYFGPNSSLVAANGDSSSTNAALCERVAIRDLDGKNVSYWIPNRASGARMLNGSTWTGATKAYSLNGCYIGDPSVATGPINSKRPSAWGVNSPNVVHYGNYASISEDSTNCQPGQFVCSVPANNGMTDVYVLMWAEGTDAACTTAALSGATTLNLEFVALSKQLWPSA